MPTIQTASPALYAHLEHFEDRRLDCYLCPSGIPTNGVGHTGPDVKMGMPRITNEQADAWLVRDVATFAVLVKQHVKVPLTQGQFDAMVSILFNAGEGRAKGTQGPKDEGRDGIIRLRDGRPSTLLRKLNAGDYAGAAEQFAAWNKGTVDGQLTVLPGLVRRREAEKALFLS